MNNAVCSEVMRKEKSSSGKKNITFSAKGNKIKLEMVALVFFFFFQLSLLDHKERGYRSFVPTHDVRDTTFQIKEPFLLIGNSLCILK